TAKSARRPRSESSQARCANSLPKGFQTKRIDPRSSILYSRSSILHIARLWLRDFGPVGSRRRCYPVFEEAAGDVGIYSAGDLGGATARFGRASRDDRYHYPRIIDARKRGE